MRYLFTNKTLVMGLILLVIGVTFIFFENTFYQYLDGDGVLHESLFMPLGVLSIFLGVLVLLILIVKKSVIRIRNRY